ncbi:MAG: hypothetical protein ACREDU_01205, partial [Methylocella sp.]
RQYERAIEPGLRAISMRPDQVDNYEGLIRAYGALGRFKEMHEILTAARRIACPRSAVLANMEIMAAILEGKTADALRRLAEFLPYVEKEGYSPAEYGYHYLRLGQAEKALPWLKLGAEGHDASLVDPTAVDLDLIAANPVTRVVLEEPGLKELMEIRARNARAAASQR